MMRAILELVAMLGASIWPVFVFANHVDSDEFLKLFAGGGSVAVLGIYKVWSDRQEKIAKRELERDKEYWRSTVARIEEDSEASSTPEAKRTRKLIGSRSALAEEMADK